MTTTYRVPPPEMVATWPDDQIAAHISQLGQAIADCTDYIKVKESNGLDAEAVKSARRHYSRGLRTAREIQKARTGERINFEPARPVHTFMSAYHSLKAVNRLLGICEQMHAAAKALLDDDDDERWEALEAAVGDMERALRDGGVCDE